MSFLARLGTRLGKFVDRVDAKIDKPAKAHGTWTQGSEQMIDSEMPEEMGRATSNRRSGYGRGL